MPVEPVIINDRLTRVLEEHGMTVAVHDDWLIANARMPAMGALYLVGPSTDAGLVVQVDIHAALDDALIMTESFAGVGPDEEAAVEDALDVFARAALPAMLGAFYDFEGETVEVEPWALRGGIWDACVGALHVRSIGDVMPELPSDLIHVMHGLLSEPELPEQVHWCRVFYSSMAGKGHECEVLLDNEPWPSAAAAVEALDWPQDVEFYSVRTLIILSPPTSGETTDEE